MNNNNEIPKKRHLTNKERCPRSYKEVEKILRAVKNCEANAKTVLHNAKLPRNIFNKVYALTFNVLKQNHILNAVIEEIDLLKKEPFFRKELAEILLHELIFGKGLPPGESKPLEVIRKYEVDITKAYNHVLNKGISVPKGIYSIPKYARINTLVTSVPEVLEDLEYLGVEQVLYDDSISESEYLEMVKNLKMKTFLIDKHFKNLLVFHSDENLANWSLYQKGHVLIQDKSSYIPPYVLNPEPSSVVIDACAAPGMKTLHLASIMENKGTLYAFERDKNRFKTLNNMLQSGHTDIYQTFCEDFNSVDVNDEKFSAVEYILLDPSCSGSGMVNRMDSVTDTEESKNDSRIQKLAGFQIILLKHALLFPSVKRVVYSTCSITEQENEYVVHEALNHFRHKFKLTHVLPNWPIRGSDEYEFGPLCLRAYPDKCFTNGFFVAMFERIDSFDGDNKFSSGKRTQKVKKNKFVKEKNANFENETSKIEKKYVGDSQNNWGRYGNEQNENNFDHLEENIDSNKKDTKLYNKKQKLFSEEVEIEGFAVKESLQIKNANCKLETNNEKKSTTLNVPELHCKKHKSNCDEFIEIQKDEAHDLENDEPEAFPKHKKSKKHKRDKKDSDPIDQYHNLKNPTNNCEQDRSEAFLKHKKKDEVHNLENPSENYKQDEHEAFPKHKKSKKHKRDRKDSDSIDQYNNLKHSTNNYEQDGSEEYMIHKKKDEVHNLENPSENYKQDEHEAVPKHKKSKKRKKDRKDSDPIDQHHNLKHSTNTYEQVEPEEFSKHKNSKKHKRGRKDSDSIDQLHLSLEYSFSNNNETISECMNDNLLHKHRKKAKNK